MAEIVPNLAAASSYVDRRAETSAEDQKAAMKTTTTLYVGNLSFFTTEEQIYEIFSKAGEIRRIVMGLDSVKKTPCGFCFVEYYSRKEAEDAMKYINNIKLDDRIIRVDWDRGFSEGRQYGRGKSGGQIRDEYRTDYDPGRGGWGTAARQEVQYDIGSDVPVGEEGGAGGGSRKRDYDSQSSGRSRDDYDRKRRRDDNSDNSRKRGRGRGRDDDDSSDDDDRPPRRSRRDSR